MKRWIPSIILAERSPSHRSGGSFSRICSPAERPSPLPPKAKSSRRRDSPRISRTPGIMGQRDRFMKSVSRSPRRWINGNSFPFQHRVEQIPQVFTQNEFFLLTADRTAEDFRQLGAVASTWQMPAEDDPLRSDLPNGHLNDPIGWIVPSNFEPDVLRSANGSSADFPISPCS